MRESIVRLEGASKTFPLPEGGTVVALDQIELEVSRNEFLTLLGPSGCGKTTLLHAISGFVQLDGGAIWLDGENITDVPAHRRPVNTVFQNYALFPHMSVDRNVGYALDVSHVAKAERDRRVGAALAMVGLGGLEKRTPRQLSGGQQQRVALARAIVARPKLLLLDEPLSALDRNLRQAMQIELKNLQAELGITFIFVTHDQEEALTMSDRVAVLHKGVIQQIDTPRNVYDRPGNTFVATFIGASNLFEGTVRRADGKLSLVTAGGEVIHAAESCSTNSLDTGSATAMLRPEQFSLGGDSESHGEAFMDIVVEQTVFVGSNYEILGHTAAGRKVSAVVPASQVNRIADVEATRRARLNYDPASVHLIPHQGPRA